MAHILAADEDETAATLIRHLNALAPQVGKRIADIGVAKSLIATFGSKVVEQLDDIDAVKRELSGLRTLPVIAAIVDPVLYGDRTRDLLAMLLQPVTRFGL